MNLRERVIQGGAYLVMREAFGLVLSFGGVVAITRLIGPANYGVYVGSLAIVLFLSELGRFGIDVYLVRREGDLGDEIYDQAVTALAASGVAIGVAAWLCLPWIVSWIGQDRFGPALRALVLTIPITILAAPAMARLERALDFRSVARIELSGQVAFVTTTIGLAVAGLGLWAPIAGFWCWQLWVLGYAYGRSGLRPRPRLSLPLVREMTRYGAGYSGSQWIWQLRNLVNPLIVGRYLGPEAVAYVSLGIRLTIVLGFVRGATWRLAIAAFAKIRHEPVRLGSAMRESMGLQILATGVPFAAFALVSPAVVPLVFGDDWTPVVRVFPLVALGFLVNSVFNMHSSVLYVFERNLDVALFHLVHVGLLFAGAFLFVPAAGVIGYGYAEIAAIPGYVVIHLFARRALDFSYERAIPWLIALVPPLFTAYVAGPLMLLLVAPAMLVLATRPQQRREVIEYASHMRRLVGR